VPCCAGRAIGADGGAGVTTYRDPVDPASPTPRRGVVIVPVGGAEDAELAADLLFGLGASAVSGFGDGALVADLTPEAVERIGRTFRPVADDGAGDRWQDHARSVRAGRRLVVRPQWVEAAPVGGDDVEVVVDAAAAFGSGSHASTRSCLAALEDLVAPGERVLDVGSGSGVLGVAALLLGAGSVMAIDVDPASVEATRHTAGLNGVGDRLVAEDTPVAAVGERFYLVLANLLVPIVEDLGPALADRVGPGGHLVVGGLLADQVGRAVAAVGLDVVAVVHEGDWSAVVLAR
jgi:ribosomal protein L11 methyltransferase